jgi:hypothetical protein
MTREARQAKKKQRAEQRRAQQRYFADVKPLVGRDI